MGVHLTGWFQQLAGIKWRRRNRQPETHIKPFNQHSQCPHWVTEVKVVQVFAAPSPEKSFARDTPPHDFVHLPCDVEFDPEKDYAQVLAEARSHLKADNAVDNDNATSLPVNHLDAYKELQSKLGKPHKPSKLRRYLFFWEKTSTISHQQMEAEFESIFSSPPHPSLKSSGQGMCHDNARRRAKHKGCIDQRPNKKGASGPLDGYARPTRRNNSGPLYTDGLPVGPFNMKHPKKSYSGPLGHTSCDNMDSYLSPYQPLQVPPSFSPLYSC